MDIDHQTSVNALRWNSFKRLASFVVLAITVICGIGFFYRSILPSLIISMFLAYLLAPWLEFIERFVTLPRKWLVAAILVSYVLAMAVATTMLAPIVYRESLAILSEVPKAIGYVAERIEPIKKSLISSGFIEVDKVDLYFKNFDLWDDISAQIKTAIQKILATTPDLIGAGLNAVLTPVILFFILTNLQTLRSSFAKTVPDRLKEPLWELAQQIDLVLKSVLKGQLIVAAILAVLYMTGLSLVGMQAALAIGSIAGICRIVPYLDVVVGIGLSLVVIITSGTGVTQLAMVGIVFVTVQMIDGMYITPRIIGNRAGIHPGIVIVSVIAFGDRFGFWGVLFAVPVVAISKVLFQFAWPIYLDSPIYRDSSS